MLFGDKKVSICMSNTSTETACLKLIFTKFARSMKKMPVRRTGTHCQKNSTDTGSLPPLRRLCFRRCLSVCLLATLRKNNSRTDLHEIFRIGWQWANEQMIKFWWRSITVWIQGFRIRHYWEIWKVVSTDCAAQRCSADQASQ